MSDFGRRRRPGRDRAEPPDWDVYGHPPPIPVENGIRARSRRGEIGEKWWSRRFVDALERYYATTESRLSRGRSYARAGQVVRIDLAPGVVNASVQGSRPKPYDVKLKFRVLDDDDWRRVEAAMAARAVFLARLLSGEMPNEIEEAFAVAGMSLFPARQGDLQTRCTCPDDANPCKHIAAVFYLLAESFDEDPFRVFEWRGRSREQLISELKSLRPKSRPKASSTSDAAGAARMPEGPEADPMTHFWLGRPGWAEVRIDPHPAGQPDAVLREMPPEVEAALGPGATVVLRTLYLAAARAARRRLDPASAGETGGATRSRRSRRSR